MTGLATGEPAGPSWRVTLHFHPDRLVAGTPILERMAHDGVYRSQFETGTGNGGLTAHPGGSPRFGSAHFRLAAPALSRTTFCYPDSFHEPRPFGVAPKLSTLIALAEADDQDPLDDYITLTTAELRRHPGYRGPEYVALGLVLARHDALDPGVIGHAARTGRFDDQHLERVWHYVARFGTPGIRS